MWAGAASSSLIRLGHIEVIFPGFTQHCVRREGYLVDPIALCEGGSASMNVAFEWRETSRHVDSLYLLYVGNRPDATSNVHNDVIMVPPTTTTTQPPLLPEDCFLLSLLSENLLLMSHKEGVSSDLLFILILLMVGFGRIPASISNKMFFCYHSL